MKTTKQLAGLMLATALLVACNSAATPQSTTDTTEATPAATATKVPTASEVTTDTVSSGETMTDTVPTPAPAPKLTDKATTTESGLQYEDTVEGEGKAAEKGNLVTVNYTGYLEDGTVFDSSIPRGEPFSLSLGAGRVIAGWDEGLVGMKPGGKRVLRIPAELAYGEEGQGMIPPDSILIFEIEMVDVTEQAKPTEVDEYETTEDGLEYAILEEGEGPAAVPGDLISFNFSAWLEDGVMFDSSEQAGRPAEFPLGQSGLTGLDKGIEGMKAGEKRQLRIPPDLAYGEEGAGNVIPPNTTIIFEIELLEIKQLPKLSLADEFTKTESGLEYAILEEGEGEEAKSDDTVVVHYTGWLEDGTLFDSSVGRGEPFTVPLGKGAVIPGWDEGLVGMKVGEKRQLRIPPDLAYGEAGSPGAIPPNSTLIFDVELLEIQAAP